MIKRYTKSINFDLYLNAAKKLDIKFKRLIKGKPIGYFHKGRKKLYTQYHWIGVNNATSFIFATNKFKTYQILDYKRYPRPRALLLKKKQVLADVTSKLKSIPKPWVVKPIKGSEGLGVTVKITKESQLKKAIEFARTINKRVIIEEFIKGAHYRILIFRKKIIDIVERIPAYVTGDSASTIEELITIKNKKREEVGMAKIRVDQELIRNLKEQKLSVKDKPRKHQRISLRKNCNLCAGGETKRMKFSEIHTDNLEMFKDAVDLLGLDLGGMDFITPDIAKSYKEIPCVVNEINKAPMGNVHYFADMAMDNSSTEEILNMYFNS